MKKQLLLILALAGNYLFAQTNPIPNYDFETWSGTTLSNWYAPSVGGCTKSTQAHGGSFALQMAPWGASHYGANAFTPATGQAFHLNGFYPTALTGWYKGNFAGGDQMQITVQVYSGGSATGSGIAFMNTSASSFTQFTVSIYNSGSTADSARIQFTQMTSGYSSSGLNAATTVTLDDLDFIGTVGIESHQVPTLQLMISPNPVMDGNVMFTLKQGVETNSRVSLFSVDGKEVFSAPATSLYDGKRYSLNCNALVNGIYLLKVTSAEATEVKKVILNK